MTYQNTLLEARKKRGTLICAHQGTAGGNVPGNTRAAFEAALQQGADMLETDVTVSKDGVIFIFHPGNEKVFLNRDIHLEQMTAEEIRKERYVNSCRAITDCPLMTLDEFLETFKNRCFINLDHGWDCLAPMTEAVRRHKMEDQILIKAPADIKYARIMEEVAPEMMYMPIIQEKDEITEQLEKMNLNFVGSELVFATENAPIAQDDYMEAQHKKGRILWGNGILYSYQVPLSAGHSDDISLVGAPECGWGWLLDKGFDIVQTDWVLPLKNFMENRK
ncbi:MAG: glycerophosphodiester phosphodiesterase family protein [Lachnospiraceae bacterium]|nr:glycerophosphodiester phosphodiesterase family protein [Lachnospiraceae bacterium]